jgi:hypothetical protein
MIDHYLGARSARSTNHRQQVAARRGSVVAPSRAKHARLPFRLYTRLMSATVPTALPRAAPGAPAEEQAAAFEDDPRVYFDTQSSRWRLEDRDAEFEYEPSRAVWLPVVSLPLPAPPQKGLRDGPSVRTLL